MEKIRLIVADDHHIVREGICQLLEYDGDMKVISEVADGIECIKKINEMKPDVVLLDINMPKMNGLDVLKDIRNSKLDVKIIILTIHNELEYVLKAIEIGVNGYVLKDTDFTTLKKAIQVVHSGATYIQPEMAALINEKEEIDYLAKSDSILTKREIQVLKLITQGLFNKEIAISLKISEKTVKNHISNIFKKINVSDRTQAAIYAIKNNIVDIFK